MFWSQGICQSLPDPSKVSLSEEASPKLWYSCEICLRAVGLWKRGISPNATEICIEDPSFEYIREVFHISFDTVGKCISYQNGKCQAVVKRTSSPPPSDGPRSLSCDDPEISHLNPFCAILHGTPESIEELRDTSHSDDEVRNRETLEYCENTVKAVAKYPTMPSLLVNGCRYRNFIAGKSNEESNREIFAKDCPDNVICSCGGFCEPGVSKAVCLNAGKSSGSSMELDDSSVISTVVKQRSDELRARVKVLEKEGQKKLDEWYLKDGLN